MKELKEKNMKQILEQIDKAIELNTQLRIEILGAKKEELESKAYEIDAILCEMHDQISLLNSENAVGVSDSSEKHGVSPHVRKRNASGETDDIGDESEQITLGKRIEDENKFYCLQFKNTKELCSGQCAACNEYEHEFVEYS